jgi:hypothetical protein
VTSIELRNPTESQPIEITQFIFQSASKYARRFTIGQPEFNAELVANVPKSLTHKGCQDFMPAPASL